MTPTQTIKRAELHTHLGAAVDPVIMWTIAHRQGIKLPVKEYWEFEDMITMSSSEKNKNLDEMDQNYFHWTELIQSSPDAIEEAVHSVVGGGYRKCNLVVQELRFNPMKRNRVGERDLDLIILSALWGMRRAMIEYPHVKAGLIVSLDRTFSFEQNAILMEKAIKYASDGIVGIDLAGPDRDTFFIQEIEPLIEKAKDAGLGITLHAGETGNTEELRYVVETIKPHRVGHGIEAAKDLEIMKMITANDIVLEVCPTSNLKNSIVADEDELKQTLRTFVDNKVKFTINTDGPEMYRTNVSLEEEFLIEKGMLTEDEIAKCRSNAFDATFVS